MSRSVTAELDGWRIEADPDLNRAHYARNAGWDCECDHCLNWRALGKRALPADVLNFLTSLGIDALKPHEVFEWGPEPGGGHLYGGWYHFGGRTLQGRPLPEGSTPASEATRLENGFRFGLYPGLGGARAALEPPGPHLTFEFTWSAPWALADPPSCGALLET